MTEPATVHDWHLAEMRAHNAALPEGHAGKFTEADVRRLMSAYESSGMYEDPDEPLRQIALKIAALLPGDHR